MAPKDPEKIIINDETLSCKHCGFDQFYSFNFDPNAAGSNFPGLSWMGKAAQIFVCARCGFFHWFATEITPEMLQAQAGADMIRGTIISETDPDANDPSEAIECMSCGKIIPPGRDRCASCGWSYKEPLKDI
jgi:hypothetical protein